MGDYIGQIASVVTIFILAIGLLIGEESVREKFSRSGSLAARWAVYTALDYGLMFLSIALVMAMKAGGHGFWLTFVAMWIFDIAMAVSLLLICHHSGQDLTLGQEYRNSTDNINKMSKIAGFISIVVFLLKAAIWDGPERLVEFLRQELNTLTRKAVVIITMCCIQAIFWTSVYILGYESISAIWEVAKINAGI